MGNQRITPLNKMEGDRESSRSASHQPESTFTKLQEVLGNRVGSDRFRADLDRHHQSGGEDSHPFKALLGSIGAAKALGNPSFRGLSHELQAETASSGMVVQAKMAVRPAGDRYEQEADRVAKQVVAQMHSSSTSEDLEQRQGVSQLRPIWKLPFIGNKATVILCRIPFANPWNKC
jgi:hypothetical protein